MKRLILLAALLLAALSAGAQTTIDFTGVSINTERVKKVYERKAFIMATGGPELFSFRKNHFDATGVFGLRFGMVWHFGFYVGAETGIGGFPAKTEKGYTQDFVLNGMRRDPRPGSPHLCCRRRNLENNPCRKSISWRRLCDRPETVSEAG